MAIAIAGLKAWLPEGVASFCIIVASGCAAYFAAAVVLDIVGIRTAFLGLLRSGRLALPRPLS
jgi:hypothetical protein